MNDQMIKFEEIIARKMDGQIYEMYEGILIERMVRYIEKKIKD